MLFVKLRSGKVRCSCNVSRQSASGFGLFSDKAVRGRLLGGCDMEVGWDTRACAYCFRRRAGGLGS